MKKLALSTLVTVNLLFGFQQIQVNVIGNSFDYKEYDRNGNEIDSESSSYTDLKGISGSYKIDINNFSIGIYGEYLKGETTYKGSTWGGTPLTLTKKNVKVLNTNINIDYLLMYDEVNDNYGNLYFTAGLGYRRWDRGKSDYAGDYNEVYYWPYYFYGFKMIDTFYNQFSIGLTATYQTAIKPKMDSDLGSGATYNLGDTTGYRIEIPLNYYITSNYGISFKYIQNYWHIKESDIKTITLGNSQVNTIEPESKTKNKLISLGIFYNF